jgi:hypothetical protein
MALSPDLFTGRKLLVVAALALAGGQRSPATAPPFTRPASPTAPSSAPPAVDAPPPPAQKPPPSPPAPSQALPDPFPERQEVTVAQLFEALEVLVPRIAASDAVRADYRALVRDFGLRDSVELYDKYVRVRIAFEATRDGGLWGVRWAITNRPHGSDEIWASWKRLTVDSFDPQAPTAIAECDEITALFCFVARKLGVPDVGFISGGWYHIVAAWAIRVPGAREVRIGVPTSQVFLTPEATLGTRELKPDRPKVIWRYVRRDVRDDETLPPHVARFLVQQVFLNGGRPAAELQQMRNARGGS